MELLNDFLLTTEEKKKCIEDFLPHLAALRAKAGVSQEELASMIGVSRQTYGTVERSLKDLSWNTFLSLLLFFDYNKKTHDILHSCGAFPDEFVKRINDADDLVSTKLGGVFSDDNGNDILESLDEQALQSIRTMAMVEYARCKKMTGEAVIKAFEGVSFSLENRNEKADEALKHLKQKRKRK